MWLLGLLALFMSLSSVYLVHYYGETRPTMRDDAAGREHAVRIHERTVYLTGGEFAAALFTHVATIVALGVFLGVLMKSRRAAGPGKNSAPPAQSAPHS